MDDDNDDDDNDNDYDSGGGRDNFSISRLQGNFPLGNQAGVTFT